MSSLQGERRSPQPGMDGRLVIGRVRAHEDVIGDD